MRPAFKNILVLGDSIADGFYDDRGLGWVGRLEEKLHEKKPMGFGFQNFLSFGLGIVSEEFLPLPPRRSSGCLAVEKFFCADVFHLRETY